MSTKILTVVYDLDRGGTQRAAQNFALGYHQLGMDSRVLTTHGLGERADSLAREGIPLAQHACGESSITAFSDWAPDIIHLHSHGLTPEIVTGVQKRWPDALLVEQNVFASPSPWMADLAVSFQLTPWCQWRYGSRGGDVLRSAVIPNPVDTSAFFRDVGAGQSIRGDLGIPVDALVLGRVGQPEPNKWHPLTVSAFEAVARERSDAHCLLIGASPDIQDLVHASRYSDRIHSVPSVSGDESLRAHYGAMDVFVHAAHQGESFGYVLAEAMLCEVPVVTLETPWADNSQGGVVGDRIGGLVARTARDFVSSAIALASDKELRVKLGSSGRDRVRSEFDVKQVAHRGLDAIHLAESGVAQPVLSYAPTSTNPVLAPMRGVESWRWLASVAINSLSARTHQRASEQRNAR